MSDIFTDYERENKKSFREERVNKIISVGKETGKTLYKGSVKTGKAISKGVMKYNPSDRIFNTGANPSVGTIKRFASSGESELHAKGSFEDMKKRFGRID